ncbi:hypothetical protein F2Q69_00012127 [Brassica cretica]|uniref:VAN3-binding protein-like auxin canalisation domain-containing protein n=1 Tax=Brassica cretica TaxID=69181 RepID=A0A8S9QWT8_BRACR|nr:hypothetical protein F2Q69_00012127 [Brassica cretica]
MLMLLTSSPEQCASCYSSPPPPPCFLSLEGMSRWLKLYMDVASAVTLADAQCMEAAEMSRAEREHLVSVVSAPSMFVMPKISGTHCR